MSKQGHVEEKDGILCWIWNKVKPKKYNYTKEKARRHRQIAKGILKIKEK